MTNIPLDRAASPAYPPCFSTGNRIVMKSGLFRASACALALVLAACGKDPGPAVADTTAAFTAAADALAARLKTGVPAASDPAVKAFDVQSGRALQALGT